MVLFYNMLDVAGVAAFIIWITLNPDSFFNDWQGSCQKSLKQLGQELTNDYIQIRLQTQSCLKSNVRNALKMIGKIDDHPQPAPAAETGPGNDANCAQHRSTRKHLEYAIFAIQMCALPIHLKCLCSHLLIVSEILNTATRLCMSETGYEKTIWNCISVMVSL